ncbi:hypothetical protein JOQ06_021782, partial [Pogonophryne albipinna]
MFVEPPELHVPSSREQGGSLGNTYCDLIKLLLGTNKDKRQSSITQVSERLLQPEDKLQGTVTLLREDLQPEDKLQGTVTLLREEQDLQPEDNLQGTVTLLREERKLQPEDNLHGTVTLLREERELQPED